MKLELTEEEALKKAAFYCAASEHCKSEVHEKLRRWGVEPPAIARILMRLEKEKYIDEERFCRAFVNDKFRLAKWGKRKIAQELSLKKIPASLAWRYLNEIDSEEYLSVLKSLLAAKRKTIKADNPYMLNAKLLRYALGRGFEMKDVRTCMELPDDDSYASFEEEME